MIADGRIQVGWSLMSYIEVERYVRTVPKGAFLRGSTLFNPSGGEVRG